MLQVALTVAVLVWLFRDGDKRAAMATALGQAEWSWIGWGLFLGLIGEVAGILRWRILLLSQGIEAGFARVSRWFFIALFFNLFLPGTTGGDLVRLYYVWRECPGQRQGAVLTLVADRLMGLIPLIVAAVLGAIWHYAWLTQTPATTGLFYGMLVFCGGMAVVIGATFYFGVRHLQVPPWIPGNRRLASVAASWGLFVRDKKRFVWTLLLSMPVLFSYYGGFYCAARAVNAGATLGQIFSIMPIVTIITSLPVSVSGIGIREGLFERLLGDLSGTPPEVASLVSLLGFAIFTFYGVLGAVVYVFSPRLQRRELEKMAEEVEPEETR